MGCNPSQPPPRPRPTFEQYRASILASGGAPYIPLRPRCEYCSVALEDGRTRCRNCGAPHDPTTPSAKEITGEDVKQALLRVFRGLARYSRECAVCHRTRHVNRDDPSGVCEDCWLAGREPSRLSIAHHYRPKQVRE